MSFVALKRYFLLSVSFPYDVSRSHSVGVKMRKVPLKTGHLYHILTKSIADYRVFRTDDDFTRMVEMLRYYRHESPPLRFSLYKRCLEKRDSNLLLELPPKGLLVDIVTYCIIPTHIHLILVQLKEEGISTFMKNLLNSYTRYFNMKNHRKGPLWQSRFKSILIETREQLFHLTRFIHLNPVLHGLTDRPEDWEYCSYSEYVDIARSPVCKYEPYLEIDPQTYKASLEDRKDYQRRLSEIKHLLLE